MTKRGIEYEYYQTVVDTQRDSEILKFELQDLLNECKQFRIPTYDEWVKFNLEHHEPNFELDLTENEMKLIYKYFNNSFYGK